MSRTALITLFVGLLAACWQLSGWSYNDPTQPSGYTAPKEAAKKKWRLESVLIGERRKLAIINGQSYQEGDRVGNAELISIEHNKVTLRKGLQRTVLELFDSGFKLDSSFKLDRSLKQQRGH